MTTTQNCYSCKHVGSVPGSAHSSCNHPCYNQPGGELAKLMALINVSGVPIPGMIDVKGNPHGIKNGWFMHPVNFDPCWLESCSGYTPKQEVKPD